LKTRPRSAEKKGEVFNASLLGRRCQGMVVGDHLKSRPVGVFGVALVEVELVLRDDFDLVGQTLSVKLNGRALGGILDPTELVDPLTEPLVLQLLQAVPGELVVGRVGVRLVNQVTGTLGRRVGDVGLIGVGTVVVPGATKDLGRSLVPGQGLGVGRDGGGGNEAGT